MQVATANYKYHLNMNTGVAAQHAKAKTGSMRNGGVCKLGSENKGHRIGSENRSSLRVQLTHHRLLFCVSGLEMLLYLRV